MTYPIFRFYAEARDRAGEVDCWPIFAPNRAEALIRASDESIGTSLRGPVSISREWDVVKVDAATTLFRNEWEAEKPDVLADLIRRRRNALEQARASKALERGWRRIHVEDHQAALAFLQRRLSEVTRAEAV